MCVCGGGGGGSAFVPACEHICAYAHVGVFAHALDVYHNPNCVCVCVVRAVMCVHLQLIGLEV